MHVPNLITVEFILFIKPHFTTFAQNILHLSWCTYGHIWPCTVAPFRRSYSSCIWFDRDQKCIGEMPVRFQQLSTHT